MICRNHCLVSLADFISPRQGGTTVNDDRVRTLRRRTLLALPSARSCRHPLRVARRRFIAVATLLAVLILAALTSAAPAGAQAALPVWRVALSLRCNSPSFCAELGGVSGREVFYADDTADAELTQSGRSLDTRPAAGAQHISAEAYGWFIAPSSQNPTVDDFWISSEVATFTGRQGGPPVVLTNPFPPYPEDTGVPAAPGHYGTNRFLGFSPPPGVAFQIEVVELTAS